MLSLLKEEVGYPFDHFPSQMFEFARGGVQSWGTLCGSLIAACGIIGLVCNKENSANLVNNLMAWYQQFPFPEYQPAGMNLPTTVAGSTLCHISVTKWLEVNGGKHGDPPRKERCGGLTADVAKFTVEMLNELADKQAFTVIFKPAAAVSACKTCHADDTIGKDDCTTCHGDPHK